MKSMRTINFLIFFLLLSFIKFQAIASPQHLKDTQLLLNFKASLPNPSILQTWLPNQNPCLTFSGVTCNNSTQVTSIDLSNTLLSANFVSVSSSLFSLEYLESLSLKSSNLSGTLSLDGKTKCGAMLSTLDLSDNSLLGLLPHVISNLMGSCPSLKSLNFSSNYLNFSGDENAAGLSSTISRLQVLDVSFNYISGSNVIPWILSSGCGGMSYLSLKGNKILGDADVSSCKKLKYLDLSYNNFSSEIPAFKDCLELEHIDLSSNKFYGDVGVAISGCSGLIFLNLSVNDFSGAIPSLPSKSLQIVSLSRNRFQGEIPSNLAEDACENLVELDFSWNKLSGTVPSSFKSCSVLESLDLSNNNISGELPIEVLERMSNLKQLALGFNSFIGELPTSFLSELVGLERLDLSSNGLLGLIPDKMCINPQYSLRELYLQNNLFTGLIPPSLSNCSKLVSLDLSFNYLKGKIPSSIGGLSNLRDLILLLNELEGEIPQELMYIPTIENLILDFNKLTGNIPDGLSNCTKLNWISLSNNQLSGKIPGWIGQLSNLAILKLSNNSFSGNIPPELGDCRSLIWLDLNSNLLNGSIPPELFKQSGKIAVKYITDRKFAYIKNDGSKGCHGAGNLLEFAGIRPEQLNRISTRNPCNFTRVYKGIIQPTFTQNGSMIFLDISHNRLSGSIPAVIGTMHNLFVLNLGHNDISGTIPSEIGDLANLNILDLSSNRLEGQIPPTMSGCSMLAEINLSNNFLRGQIPEGQVATLSSTGFSNNTGLCGLPLTPCDMVTPPSVNSKWHNSHRGQASLVRSLAMVLLFCMFCIFGLILLAIEARKRRKMEDSPFGTSTESRSPSVTATISWRLMDLTFEKPLKKLTYADLLEATNNFHHDSHIGSGGFGDVYRAQLRDGSVVAIKKLIHISGQGDREFTAEMETIGKIKHRNLVPLLGYCKVGEERLLVYEYMKYGSLEDVLHNKKKAGIKLNWPARKRIAIGAARGLAFLHHNCIPHIIHRDMKSSNVLLDDNFEARVSDFGMARLVSAMDTHLSVSTLAGTPGYVPPEYYQSFRCSTKGDVYSYGVVLLELLTGKRSTDSSDFGDNNLVGWVKQHEKLKISNSFDPELLKEGPNVETDLLQHWKIASACLDDRPSRRPNMIQVLAMFKEIQAGSGHDSASTVAMSRTTSSGRIGAAEVVDTSIAEGVELSKQQGTT